MPIRTRWQEIRPPRPSDAPSLSLQARLWMVLRRFVLWLPAMAALIAAAAGLVVLADERTEALPQPTIQTAELPTAQTARPLIDINTATRSELQTLPGIGASRAEAITTLRAIEPFSSLADLFDRGVLSFDQVNAIQHLAAVYASPHD